MFSNRKEYISVMDNNAPFELFKYRVINKNFLDSLIKSYIYFSEPANLNDPFDCRVDIDSSLNRAIEACGGVLKDNLVTLRNMEEVFIQLQEDIKSFGISAFSLKLFKPVLWSHYSGEHTGVCLLYKIPQDFINYDQNKIIGIDKIKYGNNKLTEWFVEQSAQIPEMKISELIIEIMRKVLTIKGKDWEYEKEIRIVRENSGALEIDKSFLKQICFGLDTPERDRELVYKIVKDSGYNLSFCEIVRSNSDFELSVKDL